MNPQVDFYFDKSTWQKEGKLLRKLILGCGLKEELKWGVPCYTFGKANIVLIHTFKEYCALLFFKGALLNDPEGILIQQTKNVQAGRQARFVNTKAILKLSAIIQKYIYEAIEVEKAGVKVALKKTSEYVIPEEFQIKLNKLPHLKTAFYALTPGRQRGYLLHFSAPKQSKTREARIELCIKQILNGKGLNDE
ncbi:MAG: YdeI/OmpD-associated family protein [Rhizobacter sp.]|nr:YdeI/OmpD-associated family protein [Ferruginibacter sp.]